MKVQLRYFASLRESLGAAEIIDVAPGSTVAQVRDQLIARGEPHAGALARGKAVRAALNQVLSAESALVEEGAELAFFPPVTGG
jgi:molybdopterin synthase sulfur carrier subunit